MSRVLTWYLNVSVQQKYVSLTEDCEGGGVGMQCCKLTFFVGGILLVYKLINKLIIVCNSI